jgi:hypothetical protein
MKKEENQDKQKNNQEVEYDLSEYFNHSQDDWFNLTKAFREPISSILPPIREIDEKELYDIYTIDEICNKFRGVPGGISPSKVQDWLSQFDSCLEKNLAYLLLQNIQFLSEDRVRAAAINLRDQLLNSLIEVESLVNQFHSTSKPSNKSELNFKRWLRNNIIRYAWLPHSHKSNPDSQSRLWGYYKTNALKGRNTGCPNVGKPMTLKEYFEDSFYNPENSLFVFMDYTNGSGKQLQDSLTELDKLLNEYPVWQNSIFVFVYVVQSTTFRGENISSNAKWRTVFYEPMLSYKDEKIIQAIQKYGVSESEYKDFVKKYCLRAGSTSAGYLDSGSLTCHHYSCPNNTLDFFHSTKRGWRKLFDSSQTSGATRYKS